MKAQQTSFSTWLEGCYVSWMAREGRRMPLSAFAAYLGISPQSLSHYLRGSRQPSGAALGGIALRLGLEAYDLLGYERPDERLLRLERGWALLNEAQRSQVEALLRSFGAWEV